MKTKITKYVLSLIKVNFEFFNAANRMKDKQIMFRRVLIIEQVIIMITHIKNEPMAYN